MTLFVDADPTMKKRVIMRRRRIFIVYIFLLFLVIKDEGFSKIKR